MATKSTKTSSRKPTKKSGAKVAARARVRVTKTPSRTTLRPTAPTRRAIKGIQQTVETVESIAGSGTYQAGGTADPSTWQGERCQPAALVVGTANRIERVVGNLDPNQVYIGTVCPNGDYMCGEADDVIHYVQQITHGLPNTLSRSLRSAERKAARYVKGELLESQAARDAADFIGKKFTELRTWWTQADADAARIFGTGVCVHLSYHPPSGKYLLSLGVESDRNTAARQARKAAAKILA